MFSFKMKIYLNYTIFMINAPYGTSSGIVSSISSFILQLKSNSLLIKTIINTKAYLYSNNIYTINFFFTCTSHYRIHSNHKYIYQSENKMNFLSLKFNKKEHFEILNMKINLTCHVNLLKKIRYDKNP
ncbi:hypothetical protein BpHYR1_024669 [Brachionus plicatilis]|uniref:Uncharacterized protein n=1 Tax=Brachionus plicatilis TaxID=10195 RepID=A0A3M7QVI7_BRAPC|nr:hypothetical protein BpHYR1_024669 [Brachionus plicatilis]